MADAIGPTFKSELLAAGLSLNGIGWDTVTGTLYFNDNYTSDLQDRARAVLASHDPSKLAPNDILASNILLGMTVLANGKGVPMATYALDSATSAELTGIGGIVTLSGQFPGPSPTFDYPDINGDVVTFPNTAAFVSFMVSYSGLLLAMNKTAQQLNAGIPTEWPSQSVTPS